MVYHWSIALSINDSAVFRYFITEIPNYNKKIFINLAIILKLALNAISIKSLYSMTDWVILININY